MTLYNKKFLRSKTDKRVERRVESKDALLWDVLPAQRKCRVKVQGSDKLILVDYPNNVESNPSWMKPGSAVQISFVGGRRNKLQITGTGHFIPSAVFGGTTEVPIEELVDTVISGLKVTSNPFDATSVIVTAGTFRINGVISVAVDPSALMDETSADVMDSSAIETMIENDLDVVYIDAGSSGYFRIDLIVIGTDGVVDYVKGTNFLVTSAAVVPPTPSGHLKLAHILVPPSATEITDLMINATFVLPIATKMVVVSNSVMYPNIVDDIQGAYLVQDTLTVPDQRLMLDIHVLDQYGNVFANPDGDTIIMEIINQELFPETFAIDAGVVTFGSSYTVHPSKPKSNLTDANGYFPKYSTHFSANEKVQFSVEHFFPAGADSTLYRSVLARVTLDSSDFAFTLYSVIMVEKSPSIISMPYSSTV